MESLTLTSTTVVVATVVATVVVTVVVTAVMLRGEELCADGMRTTIRMRVHQTSVHAL